MNKHFPVPLKIAFVSVRESFVEEGICHYNSPDGRLIKALQASHPELTVVTYAAPEKKTYLNLPIKAKKLFFFSFSNTFGNGLRYMLHAIRMIRRIQREHDLLIIQLPFKSFLAPLLIYKPVIYHLCINVVTAAANPIKYKGWKAVIAKSYAGLLHTFQRMYLLNPRARMIANGKELALMYNPEKTIPVVSASLYHHEVLEASKINDRKFEGKLLFVGRPSKVKGFDTLLDVFKKLKSQFPNLTLSCIGFSEEEFGKIWGAASLKEATEKGVQFYGTLPFSQALFDQYAAHDILILPSRSEGTPRVLVEARAFGCMVIASDVDGIPSSVTHEVDGLLFPAGNKLELEKQLIRLLTDASLQQTLRINGWENAKKNTIESFSAVFEETIEQLQSV